MEPRVSIITLGVGDLDRAVAFYEAMGLARNQAVTDGVAFFQMGGIDPGAVAARRAGKGCRRSPLTTARPWFGGAALAYNTRSEDEVDEVLAAAEKAGGTIVQPAHQAFFGGRQGYFADTEGNLWEVAHNAGIPDRRRRQRSRCRA